jgi:hypothetical protein
MVGIRDRSRGKKRLRNIRSVAVVSVSVTAVQIPSGRGEEFTSRHACVACVFPREKEGFSKEIATLNNGITKRVQKREFARRRLQNVIERRVLSLLTARGVYYAVNVEELSAILFRFCGQVYREDRGGEEHRGPKFLEIRARETMRRVRRRQMDASFPEESSVPNGFVVPFARRFRSAVVRVRHRG